MIFWPRRPWGCFESKLWEEGGWHGNDISNGKYWSTLSLQLLLGKKNLKTKELLYCKVITIVGKLICLVRMDRFYITCFISWFVIGHFGFSFCLKWDVCHKKGNRNRAMFQILGKIKQNFGSMRNIDCCPLNQEEKAKMVFSLLRNFWQWWLFVLKCTGWNSCWSSKYPRIIYLDIPDEIHTYIV